MFAGFETVGGILAEQFGVEGFMTKPFSNREIVERVRRLVRD